MKKNSKKREIIMHQLKFCTVCTNWFISIFDIFLRRYHDVCQSNILQCLLMLKNHERRKYGVGTLFKHDLCSYTADMVDISLQLLNF